MKKLLCCLIGAGTLLFWAACSDDKTSISVESPNPGDLVGTESDVRCDVADPNHPDDTLHGCVFSTEMWYRNSGYRVHTDLDNGTNTSGVWYWSVNAADGRNVRVNWNQPLTADYDSMTLSNVIDQCKGSLCGMVVFDALDESSRSVPDSLKGTSSFSLEFSFAGKDASGKYETVDARDMQGICIEYFADAMRMELNLGDSLNALMDGEFYGVELPPYPVLSAVQGKEVGNRICYPWEQFVLSNAIGADEAPVSIEEAVSHLQGLRFTISSNQDYAFIDNFDIVGLGRYLNNPLIEDKIRPLDESCEVLSVKDYYCKSSYPDERAEQGALSVAMSYLLELKSALMNSGEFVTVNAENCVRNLALTALPATKLVDWKNRCDQPLPMTFACVDGSESVSLEYAEMRAVFDAKTSELYLPKKALVDSLYAECLSMVDYQFNGEPIPDTCKAEELLSDRSIYDLKYASAGASIAMEEFFAMLDSLYGLDSLDDATRYCVLNYRPTIRQSAPLAKPLLAPPPVYHPLVKLIRCKSGNVYYSDEYKDFLEELGIKDDTDSSEVANLAKETSRQYHSNLFNTCVEDYEKSTVMWNGVWTRVNTGFDNGSGTSGKWYYMTDSAYGGNSHIEWDNGYVVKDWNDPNALDSVFGEYGYLIGTVHYEQKDTSVIPFVYLGFWLAGEDGKGGHDAVDITDKKGICVVHSYSDVSAFLELDLGDSLKAVLDDDVFDVNLSLSYGIYPVCYEWSRFKQAGWGPHMDLEEALKHVVGIRWRFQGNAARDKKVRFNISEISYMTP